MEDCKHDKHLVEQQILDLEELNRRAEVDSDLDALSLSWSDDFTMTDPTGVVHQKAALLSRPRPAAVHRPTFEVYSKDDFQVQVYPDTAIAHFRVIIRGQLDAKAIAHSFQFTNVWVRKEDVWKLAASQATTISAPPEAVSVEP